MRGVRGMKEVRGVRGMKEVRGEGVRRMREVRWTSQFLALVYIIQHWI